MDDKPCGGLQAVLHSRILMKGHRKELFLLDLSFWWFYLLELGIFILSAGNLLLSAMGIALPLSDAVAAWVFPLIALLAYLALHWLAKPKLEITYALFYRDIYEKGLKEASAYQLDQPPQQD